MCKRELLRALLISAVCIPAWCTPLISQIKWDGGGGDGLWSTSSNWINNLVPSSTDSVVFDNSLVSGNYTVLIPASVNIKVIVIKPASGRIIELNVPSANNAVPALSTERITIHNGGVCRNESGADSGQTIIVSDTLRINNGGRYIQQTERSHAALVTRLSRAPGTEEGIFEFDVPSASNTLSLSGRVFGKLVLSSNAQPGATTYTASGTNGAIIRSDLVIGEGVNFSLNMSDTLVIRRDLLQEGGTFNMGNAARTLVTALGRHLIQSGIITESGSAVPEILFNGSEIQKVTSIGAIQNSVACSIHNPAGIALLSALSLPFSLHLKTGSITTSQSNLLRLLPGCLLIVDSLNGTSFVNGPLRVEGLSNTARLVLPLGKDKIMRWLALVNATGNFTAEYIKNNPRMISTTYDTGIHHIMSVEYWSIRADPSPLPAAAIELSYIIPTSIDITDLSALRVAWLNANSWVNGSHAGATGSAGASGTVLSKHFTDWTNSAINFALASSRPSKDLLSLTDRPPPLTSFKPPTPDLLLRIIDFAPASGLLICHAPEKTNVKVVLMNSAGVLVSTTYHAVEKGINKIVLNTKGQPAGLYFIQAFSTKKRSNVFRIVRL